MSWNPARVRTWMKTAARELASDFIDMPLSVGVEGECLRASAGALYYAVDARIGYRTKEEFWRYMIEQVGWDENGVIDQLEEFLKPDKSGYSRKRKREDLVAAVERKLGSTNGG